MKGYVTCPPWFSPGELLLTADQRLMPGRVGDDHA